MTLALLLVSSGAAQRIHVVSTEKGFIEQIVSAEMFTSFKGIAGILDAISLSEPIKHISDAIVREVSRRNSRNVKELER